MTKLHQIIAVLPTIQSKAESVATKTHHAHQKTSLFEGFTAEYRPVADDGEQLPPDGKGIEARVRDTLSSYREALTDLFKASWRRDYANMSARADIVVDGTVIAEAVPVTHLMFLEKQLVNIKTWASKIPILGASDVWNLDDSNGLYRSEPRSTHRTNKEQAPIVLYDATKEHPAQTQLITKDVLVGHWHKTKFSSALPFSEKEDLIDRVDKLTIAVKEAREAANGIDVPDDTTQSKSIIQYIFG